MKMYKRAWMACVVCIVVLTLVAPIRLCAAEKSTQKKQIVFLLDASKSMKESGYWKEAVDSVFLMSEVLPDNYDIAVLVYNAEVIVKLDFNEFANKEQLLEVEMKGYTNPGIAIEEALEMLIGQESAEQRIVIISDGEISMPQREQTEVALMSYEEAISNAVDKGIVVDAFILKNDEIQEQISRAIEGASGAIFTDVSSEKLSLKTIEYLFESLKLERIEIDVSQTNAGQVEVDLLDCYLKSAKVVLWAEQEIADVHVSGQCEQLDVYRGTRHVIAELQEPLNEKVLLEYTLLQKGKVHIYLIKEYDLATNVQAKYKSDENIFELGVNIVNHRDKKLLDIPKIDESMNILVDGKAVDYNVENGVAFFEYATPETKEIDIEVNLDKMNSVIWGNDLKQKIELEVPTTVHTEDEEQNYTALWVVIAGLCVAVLFLVYLYERKGQKKNTRENPSETTTTQISVENSKFDFSGQITVYVLKGGKEDIPPHTLKLYGRNKKEVSFDWIKDCCNIQLNLKDADKIRFSGGKENALCLKNNGCASVIKKREILLRGKLYSLSFGEKVLLIFNDGAVEIELHYKNIKPSER